MIIEMISTLFILSISVFLEYDFNTVYIKCLCILSRLGKTNMIIEMISTLFILSISVYSQG